jgi:hypothetical protein
MAVGRPDGRPGAACDREDEMTKAAAVLTFAFLLCAHAGCGGGSAAGPCEEGLRRCTKDEVEQCQAGEWVVHEDCIARGQGCIDTGGAVQCSEPPSGAPPGSRAASPFGEQQPRRTDRPQPDAAGSTQDAAAPDANPWAGDAGATTPDTAEPDGPGTPDTGGGPEEKPTCPATQSELYAVPTFHSLGIYWKPAHGSESNECSLSYRRKGEAVWKEALPMWFDDRDHASRPERSHEYRGSVVSLSPGTLYEIKVRLEGTGDERSCTARTWREDLPIAKTVKLPAGETKGTYKIQESGTREGYVLYDGTQATIAGGTNNVEVAASYVIIRGLTARDAAVHGIKLGDVHDVVIEDCEVRGWGRIASDGFGENLDAAVYSESKQLERIVVQRCDLHHPRSSSNSWSQSRPLTGQGAHPFGPQGIVFRGSKGNHVIRHNHIFSDEDHGYNDGMGEVQNFSYGGFPNRDSDIYANEVSNAWDDGIETEGANMNVRVWGNFTENVMIPHGCATTSLGPLYLFRNTNGRTRTDSSGKLGSAFLKLGYSDSADEYRHGKMYVLHNTVLQPDDHGPRFGLLITSSAYRQYNITSRNNILHVLQSPSISGTADQPGSSFDYDMHSSFAPQEPHGFSGKPVYDTSPDGRRWLRAGTPGHDQGVRIPNFNDDFLGAAPDLGAFENGSPPAP